MQRSQYKGTCKKYVNTIAQRLCMNSALAVPGSAITGAHNPSRSLSLVEKGIGYKADIAPFKFCYVDITIKTDIEKAFASHLKTMSRPRKDFPKTALKLPLINPCSY